MNSCKLVPQLATVDNSATREKKRWKYPPFDGFINQETKKDVGATKYHIKDRD